QFLEPDNDFLKRVPLLYFKERFDNLGYDKRHNLLMHVILILQEEGTLEQHIERLCSDFEQSEDLMVMFWNSYTFEHQLSAPQVLLQTCMEKNPDRCGEFLSQVLKLPSEHGKGLDRSTLLKLLFVDLCAAKAKGLVTTPFIPIYRAMIEHFSGGKNILRATDILEEKRPGAVFWTGSNILVLSSLEQKELSALVQRQIKKGYPLLTSFGVL
ncbi:MAG: hypothetical protein Q8R11_00650, partial [bacterium]|nr:hypothetical protein [bacterium]